MYFVLYWFNFPTSVILKIERNFKGLCNPQKKEKAKKLKRMNGYMLNLDTCISQENIVIVS
jgi:hypothetical protein